MYLSVSMAIPKVSEIVINLLESNIIITKRRLKIAREFYGLIKVTSLSLRKKFKVELHV